MNLLIILTLADWSGDLLFKKQAFREIQDYLQIAENFGLKLLELSDSNNENIV